MNPTADWTHIVRPPAHYMIRAGSAEQRYRDAFTRGARDGLREAWRVCCRECRPKIAVIADRYRELA
jgi:hypothetical protein